MRQDGVEVVYDRHGQAEGVVSTKYNVNANPLNGKMTVIIIHIVLWVYRAHMNWAKGYSCAIRTKTYNQALAYHRIYTVHKSETFSWSMD